MNNLIKSTIFTLAVPVLTTLFPSTSQAQEPPCPFDESRSGLCGYYHSESSPTEAYLDAVVKGEKSEKHGKRAIILDVRSTSEYRAGHPEGSYNVPSPYIYQYCDAKGRRPDGACITGGEKINQTPEAFVSYVESIAPDKDTPIYTLCRTGVRSVGAANYLTDAGYTNVRNIWEGFVGINLTAPKVQEDGSIVVESVDLNHDGQLTDEDKNGWRYHQGLPYDTRLKHRLIYQPFAYTYDWE